MRRRRSASWPRRTWPGPRPRHRPAGRGSRSRPPSPGRGCRRLRHDHGGARRRPRRWRPKPSISALDIDAGCCRHDVRPRQLLGNRSGGTHPAKRTRSRGRAGPPDPQASLRHCRPVPDQDRQPRAVQATCLKAARPRCSWPLSAAKRPTLMKTIRPARRRARAWALARRSAVGAPQGMRMVSTPGQTSSQRLLTPSHGDNARRSGAGPRSGARDNSGRAASA